MFFMRKKEGRKKEEAKRDVPKKEGRATKGTPKQKIRNASGKLKKGVAKRSEKADSEERTSHAEGAANRGDATPTIPVARPAPKTSEIRERLRDGWLKALITFELVGKPREHIEETLKAYLANIKNDSRILGLKEEYADAMELEDGLFSAFCEFETLVEDLEALTWLAINFMPASIELLEPGRPSLESRTVTNWYNDLLSKLHETSNVLREERGVNRHLTEALNALIKNGILACVRSGEKSPKALQEWLGIPEEQLAPFLQHLVEKKRLVERNGAYALP